MQWQRAFPYSIPLGIIAVALLALAVYVWRRRAVPGAWPLFALGLGAAQWALGYGLEISTAGSDAAILWAKLQYLGITTVPVAWLLFALSYSGQTHRLTGWKRASLFLLPVVTNLLVWTNELHGWIWPTVQLDTAGPVPILAFGHGPAFWICNLASHLMLAAGTVIIIQTFLRGPQIFASQVATMLLAVCAPWLGNLVYVFGLNPLANLDLTPFAFSIAAFAVTLGVWRYRFLEVVPVARGHLFEHLQDGILVLDSHGRVVDCNQAARAFLGAAHELVGHPVERVLARWPALRALASAVPGGDGEVSIEGAHGSRTIYSVRVSHLAPARTSAGGRLVVWSDVTERKHAEDTLRRQNEALLALQDDLIRARDAAESANRAKSVFLANMSHELRTPLAAILGYTELIQMQLAEVEDRQFDDDLGAISTAGNHLLGLINTVLDVTKIEAGRVELETISFPIKSLIDDIATTVRPLVARNQNTLEIAYAEDVEIIQADPLKLRQVLLNLLGNAAKFTEHGRICLQITATPGQPDLPDGAGWVLIAISDTGIGIDAQMLPRLFEPFMQAAALPNRLNEGTGLGLHLSRRLCQLMGGDLTAESTPGSGSTFVVRLPRSPAEDTPAIHDATIYSFEI